MSIALSERSDTDCVRRLVALGLTRRQAEIYTYICMAVMRDGSQPSLREIGHRFDIKSANGVLCHLRLLTKKGWIEGSECSKRSLRLLRTLDGSPFTGFIFREEDQ